MANRRQTYIENQRVLADSGVITTPVNVRDIITSLYIEVRATNGATSNIGNTVAENIQEIALLDGANVLMSMSGTQFVAKECYDKGWIPPMLIEETPSVVQSMHGEIKFGRWFGDTVYGLDPSKFSNLQLRLTWNLATIRAVGVTGFATGTGRFTVLANIMEGAPAPQAMLVSRQHYQFTTAATGVTYIDLPTDRRIRNILLRSSQAAANGIPGISRIKLTADQDKFIALDVARLDFRNLMSQRNPPFSYRHPLMAANAATFSPILKYAETVDMNVQSSDTVLGYANVGAGFGVLSQITGGVADANLRYTVASVGGYFPYHSGILDLGEYDDPSSWFDATQFNSVQLQLTNDAAASAASVVLEQEYVY